MGREKSNELFARATHRIPGGVNSPVRAFKAVGGNPVFMERGEGPYIYDVDGNRYLDFVMSWGPLIAGHAHPEVIAAVKDACERGLTFGAPTGAEVELAEMICDAFPSIDKVRMVNSGTEATMSAIRLARAYTGRRKIIKMAGCYHGHADAFLIQAGSGLTTLGAPSSPGVPESVVSETLICPFNDTGALIELLEANLGEVAAVIMEPVPGNMGLVLPLGDYLHQVRTLTHKYGVLLIFDEVITGFRIAYGGVQTEMGVEPDLTTLGKIIGGGMPVGAFGGRKDIMALVSPDGPVYQAGTLAGNPVAMAAGLATLRLLKRDQDCYDGMGVMSYLLSRRIVSAAEDLGLDVSVNRLGGMMTPFFNKVEVFDYETSLKSDTALYARFFRGMLDKGVYLPCSQFETWMFSFAHSLDDIEFAASAAVQTLEEMAAEAK